MEKFEKTCPFMDGAYCTDSCELWDEMADRCTFRVISDALWKLNEKVRK